MAVNLGTAIGYLDLDTKKFVIGLDKAYASLKLFGDSTDTINEKLMKFSRATGLAGKLLTATITAPVIGFTAASVKAGAGFDSSMSKVKAVAYTTMDDIDGLQEAAENLGVDFVDTGDNVETSFNTIRNAAIKMGNDTKFTAQESAEALYYMGLAGWNSAEMLNGLQGILDLSAASGVDLAQTSDIVTDALTAFGKEASYSTDFANALAAASANSNTNVDLLGESFKYVAPVAGAYGYSIQDVTLALGLMASAGVKGTQAGTGLRQALKQLTNPTDKNLALMEKYGVTLQDDEGNMLSLREVMNKWRESFGDLNVELYDTEGNLKTGEQILEEYGHSLPTSEFEKLNAVANIFGTRALPGVLAIIGSGDEDFDELAAAIDGANESFDGLGEAMGQARMRNDNLAGDWVLFTSALGTAKIVISDMLNGVLRGLVQGLTNIVRAFNTAPPVVQKLIFALSLLAAAVGPILLIISGISFVAAHLVGTFGSLSAVLSGIALGPIAIVVAAIAGFIAIIVHLWKTNEDFRNKIISIWNNIKQSITNFVSRFKEQMQQLKEHFAPVVEDLKKAWDAFCNMVAPAIEAAFSIVGTIIDTALTTISYLIDAFIAFINGDWDAFWNSLYWVVETVLDGVFTAISTWGQGLIDTFRPLWDALGEIVSNAMDFILNKIVEIGLYIVTKLKEVWDNTVQNALTAWNNMKTYVIQKATDIKNKTVEKFNEVKQRLLQIWNNIWSNISSAVNNIKTTVVQKWNDIKTDTLNKFNNIKSTVKEKIDGVKQHISEGLSNAKETVERILGNIKEAFTKAMDKAKETVKSGIDKIKSFFDFSWSLPHLKLPHFSVSGSFSLNPPSVPHFGISWYKKAMRNGILMNEPTIFGWDSKTGKFLAGGEAGTEVIVGARSLIDMIRDAVRSSTAGLTDKVASYCAVVVDAFTLSMNMFASVMDTFVDAISDIVIDTSPIKGMAVTMKNVGRDIKDGYRGITTTRLQDEDIYKIANAFYEVIKEVPIENKVVFDVKEGDVNIDGERVGRRLEPIISRIQATS